MTKIFSSNPQINEAFLSSIKKSVDLVLVEYENQGESLAAPNLIGWRWVMNQIGRFDIKIYQSTPLYAMESVPEHSSKFDPLDFFDSVKMLLCEGEVGPRIWMQFNHKNNRATQEWIIMGNWGDQSFIINSPEDIADSIGYDRDKVIQAFNAFDAAIKTIVKAASIPTINGSPIDSRNLYFQVTLDDINDSFIDEDEKIEPELWDRFKDRASYHADEEKLYESLAGGILYLEKHYA